MGKARKLYTTVERLEYVEYAEIHGNKATEREKNVSEKLIIDWGENKIILSSMPCSNTWRFDQKTSAVRYKCK